MLLKDYYTTLEVGPKATEQEIKKSFRRLVLRFHPDHNGGDAVAEARFREIREAYEVLSDPRQREEYNYKRWYNRSLGSAFQAAPLTPQGVLDECLRLYRYVEATGSTRIDYAALSYHIRKQILTDDTIRLLRQVDDAGANGAIVRHIIACCRSLPWRFIEPIAELMREVVGKSESPEVRKQPGVGSSGVWNDDALRREIDDFVVMHAAARRWKRYRIVVVIVVTILLCGLIWLAGHGG